MEILHEKSFAAMDKSRMLKYLLAMIALIGGTCSAFSNPKIYIAFLWHMHQPIYTPGLNPMEVDATGDFDFSIVTTHTDRTGPYTNWPSTAVNKLISAGLPGGAQVSFSGSLIENLNAIEAAGKGFKNWKQNWNDMAAKKTDLGNQRLDMVGFAYYHPLLALIDPTHIERQIEKHKAAFAENFPDVPYSKGFFPPENAFEEHMIPSLVHQGFEWVMVDNSHFDRACSGLPYEMGFSIVEPNQADVQNENPGDWVKLSDMYAPGKISAGWGHRPHWIQYVDPEDGNEYRIVAVPTSFLFGNEDGRGGFGALQYEKCLSQLEPYNTDDDHPLLVVLHHDGDNHGGGSDSYYHNNFQAFVDWLKTVPDRFECTTIDDYLERFPPADDDLIHVESGSWYGAGADPEFLKWNGDEGSYAGATVPYSPDHNSWGIITAAANVVATAEALHPEDETLSEVWDYLMVGETSCYWYWDGTQNWDSKTSVAANLAYNLAGDLINGGTDTVGPSIYHPQREPYNPGATEWGSMQSTDFEVWTYVYDVSGLASVKLKYRIDGDGVNPLDSNQNETYDGGNEVGEWHEIEMVPRSIPSITSPLPMVKADEYSAEIRGLEDVLVDYYVEATDECGNVSHSIILHVYVGAGAVVNPGNEEPITVYLDNSYARWAKPHIYYWQDTGGNSGQIAMDWEEGDVWTYTIPGGQSGFLFSQGDWGSQTEDIRGDDMQNNHIYYLHGTNKYSVTHAPYQNSVAAVGVDCPLKISVVSGGIQVEAVRAQNLSIFTLAGQEIKLELPMGNSFIPLASGFYLINSKKYFIL